jgi:hypothetical protein
VVDGRVVAVEHTAKRIFLAVRFFTIIEAHDTRQGLKLCTDSLYKFIPICSIYDETNRNIILYTILNEITFRICSFIYSVLESYNPKNYTGCYDVAARPSRRSFYRRC